MPGNPYIVLTSQSIVFFVFFVEITTFTSLYIDLFLNIIIK